ncbi:hypothetical protein M2164_005899 [Streptomyces sp. SAI-208]|uniref:hypothetical protein n=1 Tax=Streptomyces sp. SAI-208 TaxID=2940550 RepID=UPI002473D753|nr:hypothetical protein [Streptomyces sp. SAI-208]MDH6610264.1 hypothetical protein [Streptomyces sp. SAI-208]
MTDREPCRTTRHCADHGWCHRCAPHLATVSQHLVKAIKAAGIGDDKSGEMYAQLAAVFGQPLVQVGWYCWRCAGLVEQPCRSDNVPIHVPAEWADDMIKEIRRLGEEDN